MKPGFSNAVFATVLCLVLAGCSSGDAYVYGVPANARFSYTDIPMSECAWCRRSTNLNRHHIVPVSVDETRKNDPGNIVVLCRECHFVLGHRRNWKTYNPDVLEIVNVYTNSLTN